MKTTTILLFLFISFSSVFAQSNPFEARRSKVFEEIGDNIALIKNSGRDYVLKMNVNWNYYYLTGDQSEEAFLVLNGKDETATIFKEAPQYSRQQQEMKEIKAQMSRLMVEKLINLDRGNKV